MNRTGFLVALGIAAVVGLVFGFYPDLDIRISRLFFDPDRKWLASGSGIARLRDVISWTVALIAAPAVVALIGKLVAPRRPMLIPGRAALLMVVTLGLAPGILTNVLLKDQWGRPRPIDVTEFRGPDTFLPWWDPRGVCPKNCSFVAGEPSGAFWTLAPAAVVPPAWRVVAYGGALVFGALVGLLRIAGGGHFFSDVMFSGVFTFLVVWIVHGWLYRWPYTRTTDEEVEQTIARVRGGAARPTK
jgi:lipid A 4'-phosphatase